jgi:hypothetical protein
MPLRPARRGRVGVIGAPVAKTAVVARAVSPGPSPVAKTAVVAHLGGGADAESSPGLGCRGDGDARAIPSAGDPLLAPARVLACQRSTNARISSSWCALGSPEAWLLESCGVVDEASNVNGATLAADAGWSAA